MKVLLAALNAKYIHSNLAIRSLSAYAAKLFPVEICEYTINQNLDDILADLYRRQPDLIGFSCYIFNVEPTLKLISSLKKLLPRCRILLGGPETSYRAKELLEYYPEIDFIISGEGEIPFFSLLKQAGSEQGDFSSIPALHYRDGGHILQNIPLPYTESSRTMYHYTAEEIQALKHKIIYFESSRGCPFRCSYCMSSLDKTVSYFPLDDVEKQLQLFLDTGVKQVKFIDRTFNCHPKRALRLWKFIKEHDNGITNFHFEIAADLLTESEISLIQSMRPGSIQLEIGVQTTNQHTLSLIRRNTDLTRLFNAVRKLQEKQNVHLHLDLIAGLPEENLDSFRRSFDDVYRARPHQLQLGFLKLLHGTPLFHEAPGYGIIRREYPPYEVLMTNVLSYHDLCRLKQIEEMVELFYNSGRFRCCLRLFERHFASPFSLFERLSEVCNQKRTDQRSFGKFELYQYVLKVGRSLGIEEELMKQAVKFDLFHRERLQILPDFLSLPITKQNSKEVIAKKKEQAIGSSHHLEHFDYCLTGTFEKGSFWYVFHYPEKDLYGNTPVSLL